MKSRTLFFRIHFYIVLRGDRCLSSFFFFKQKPAYEVRISYWSSDVCSSDLAGDGEPVLNILSFGFARGLPRNADLVFYMRYLRNPHWDPKLKPGTGLDADVAAYVVADPAYEDSVSQIERLILTLLPSYRAEGQPYVTLPFGCPGGRPQSVHRAARVSQMIRASGYETVPPEDTRGGERGGSHGRCRWA